MGEALSQLSALVFSDCVETSFVCALSSHCNEPVSVVAHSVGGVLDVGSALLCNVSVGASKQVPSPAARVPSRAARVPSRAV